MDLAGVEEPVSQPPFSIDAAEFVPHSQIDVLPVNSSDLQTAIAGAQGDNAPAVVEVTTEDTLRRGTRNRKPPDRFKDFVMSNSSQVVVQEHWRDKVSVLIELLDVFPSHRSDICVAILDVITHAK